jgi:hypothetical protein
MDRRRNNIHKMRLSYNSFKIFRNINILKILIAVRLTSILVLVGLILVNFLFKFTHTQSCNRFIFHRSAPFSMLWMRNDSRKKRVILSCRYCIFSVMVHWFHSGWGSPHSIITHILLCLQECITFYIPCLMNCTWF